MSGATLPESADVWAIVEAIDVSLTVHLACSADSVRRPIRSRSKVGSSLAVDWTWYQGLNHALPGSELLDLLAAVAQTYGVDSRVTGRVLKGGDRALTFSIVCHAPRSAHHSHLIRRSHVRF